MSNNNVNLCFAQTLEDVKKLHKIGLHTHTEGSNGDSAEQTVTMIEGAAKKGFSAIAITNHGTLTETEIARDIAKKCDIKVIYGVEAYYQKVFGEGKRGHLILMAKDRQGYQALCKAVSASNRKIDNRGTPIMDSEILVKFFGKGNIGYDHVIATSACCLGVLANILLSNSYIDKEIEKLENKKSTLPSPKSPEYIKIREDIENDMKLLEKMTEKYNEALALSKKSYKALKAKAERKGDVEELALLTAEEAKSEEAKKAVPSLRSKKNAFSKALTEKKNSASDLEKKIEKWTELDNKIISLRESKKGDPELFEETKKELYYFKEIFGENNFYIELQNHGIYDELYVFSRLAQLASETNTPVVAANDAHMLNGDDKSVRARRIVRTLRFDKAEEAKQSDKELYLKTPEEISLALSDFLSEETILEALNNTVAIAEQCNVEFPDDEKHYPVWKCKDGKTDKEELEDLARAGITWRYGKGWTAEHEERLNYELGVIDSLGFNSYILIVQDFLAYARMLGQLKVLPETAPTMEELKTMPKDFPTGIGVGPGRGSAVGSIVCYLLGITAIDPIKYNLIFERFLNTERVSMPDIDSDFRSDIRELVVEYCSNKYGKDAVCGIMGRSTFQAKGAVRAAGRALGIEEKNSSTAYAATVDSMLEVIDANTLSESEEMIKKKFSNNKTALKIFEDAQCIDGVFTSVTKHAAAVCISDSDITDVAPLIYVKGKDSFCTQYDKNYVEGVGIIKMDFLGLTNLSFIDTCARYVQKDCGETFDIEFLPQEKAVYERIFQKGKTNAVFQFESAGMKKMLKSFSPETLEDLILLVAAYRPGPMQYLDNIIKVKHGEITPEYVIPEMSTILDTTYGYPVYQEQILQIFNKFAGFSLGEADIIRRYMSKKKTDKFALYKDRFIEGLMQNGAEKTRAEDFWNQLLDFSKYAFNKSHAAAYAYLAYVTAWLKYHYPKEYFCAVMNYVPSEKLISVFSDCRDRDIKVSQPHINYSADNFSIKGNSIVYGFSAVKNCGAEGELIRKERSENGPYKSFIDFLLRTKAKKDAVRSLILAGAFDCFVRNRKGLADSLDDYYAILSKIKKKEMSIESAFTDNGKPKTATQKAADREKLEELKRTLDDIRFVNSEENKNNRLANEKEVLGMFVSASPLDGYKMPDEIGFSPIANLDGFNKGDTVTVMGFISEFSKKNRKSDGAEMGFFKLEDITGIVRVCCFAKEYSRFKDIIADGKVVRIFGSIQVEDFKGEKSVKLMVKEMSVLPPAVNDIVIAIKNRTCWPEIKEKIGPFMKRDGHPLKVFDILEQQIYDTPYRVSDEISKIVQVL